MSAIDKALEFVRKFSLPEDKANHFIAGLFIFFLFGVLAHPIAGLAASIMAGFFKEIKDRLSKNGTPDLLDFIATVAGGLAGYVCSLV